MSEGSARSGVANHPEADHAEADRMRTDPPEPRAAPMRIGPVGRAPTERWLQANGLPACVQGHSRPSAVLARPLALLCCAAVILGLAVYVVLVADLPFGTGAVFVGGAVLVAAVGSYAMTAIGIPEVAVFTVGWFARTVWRTGSGLIHVLPLLLVAVTFFFLAGETWMSIGRLSGLPLVLTMTLIVALAVVALLRRDGVDWRQHRVEPDAEWFRRMVPRHLMPGGPIRYADPAPGFGERVNLRLLSVLGRVLVAVVVGLGVMAFFLIFGVLTVDASVAEDWAGAAPRIWWQATVANHTYVLTAEHFRVASFLGAFSALYFIVSSSADKELAAALSDDTAAHLHRALAVRALYRAQLQPSTALVADDDEAPAGRAGAAQTGPVSGRVPPV